MTRPRSSRSRIPSARTLGLTRPRAQEDLEMLGWVGEEHVEVLVALGSTGDPDLALNNVVRLVEALRAKEADGELESVSVEGEVGSFSDATADTLLEALVSNTALRRRLFALFGASGMLGDHIVAHPEHWVQLALPLPDTEDMMKVMLDSVGAVPVEKVLAFDEFAEFKDDSEEKAVEIPHEGNRLYRARLTGPEADNAMRVAYRTLLARVASIDVEGTYVVRGEEDPTPLPFVTLSERLADSADAALTAALAVACSTVYGGPDDDNAKPPARLAVLAMGKCGARELNYISDVDVIFVAEPADSRAMRWAGEFINIGSRVFFEVDAALRPEGKQGALVRTLASHKTYYDRWAATWEFQALLKARPMSGDLELGQQYVDALAPKVWTASQRDDFVPDVQKMRKRVIDNVPEDIRSRELKLGPGGLRDVEFAVQLLQMVHGRVDESLRVRSTVQALNALVDGGYIGREDCKVLVRSYEYMRLLEHRLQLFRLKRTHTLPPQSDLVTLTWLSRTAGTKPEGMNSYAEQLEKNVKRVSVQIHQLHSKLFYRPLLTSVVTLDEDTIRLTPDAAKRQLAALGYENPDRAYDHLTALASGGARKNKLQAIILPTLLEWLAPTVDPDAGLLAYRKLSEAAKDKQWFLRLLRDENVVGQRLMFLLGTSPYLAELLLNSVDTVKLLSDGAKGPKLTERDPAVVTHSLVSAVARHRDPDKAIAIARSLRRAELARVAAADLLGFMDVEEVCQSLSLVWDAVLEAALQAEIRAWEDQNGQNAPAKISVIGMGRLGGAELGYGSDADVMFVTEPVDIPDDDDEREKTENRAVKWAASMCDSVRMRLGRPSQDPPLDVDMDLRPEGRNGAVVRTMESYERYYREWGETWEKQALLRATWIAGDKDLGIRFLRMIDQFRYPEGGVSDKTVQEVRRMKARVDAERLPAGADRKTHTKLGHGALADVEWTVQLLMMQNVTMAENLRNTSTLEALQELANAELISQADAEILREAWITATNARNAIVLVNGKRKDQLPTFGKPLAQVAAAADWDATDSQGFLDDYLKRTRRARRVVDRVFWGEDVLHDFGGVDFHP
ncbi:bifunctional [glutamine synthetase] adenylyltransferase/[glutamine synthetase]-adenylyl-L-tyrosine phosphorylase [Corynebacterium anserum]|uniref:Bifunctional [glutamine synthetase] adenylyltransferase/[glutamine synthetase]-adenylyl-L-tyrosine phosphorylase n=1 Tax=Corynebacterium anserum TaxID=2684406 RepID=A0A7G7YMT0_9CORY|nr:bifunctional [glutamine synthetase] adenylyltransferase/[glutamine synthetase]-adenylyl-L-tyrosine phosphorylase [Corynebacterium anserum]MBC2681177.1 bifunctional [glutamine synthetase] adenylyltransferase/[glutamine synthetase]-adenylyl-L-tyrosine phosphorylase [Corynebacterium anserum]QNH95800.1 bifunctional [glutamine synthetase] adenylyltransferase/[glutamine synthetase]-adenylyl-L-tyrosine phosphorylase [Corynebacterium anserum]